MDLEQDIPELKVDQVIFFSASILFIIQKHI